MTDELFSFPEIPPPQRVALLRTLRPASYGLDAALELAGRLGTNGRAEDLGARIVVRDDRSVFEFFVASGSMRWSAWPTRRTEAESEPQLLGRSEAVDRALSHLQAVGLDHEAAAVHSVTDLELSFARRDDKTETTWAIARQVNFRFTWNGLAFFGPGAKMQVSIAEKDEVVETYKFWREVQETAEATTIGPEEVINALRRDPSFGQLKPGEASVIFHGCRLGYYALPPREMQRIILPVYKFEGTVSAPALKHHDFFRYVPAIAVPEKPGLGPRKTPQSVASF